jgi:hypothetical protein
VSGPRLPDGRELVVATGAGFAPGAGQLLEDLRRSAELAVLRGSRARPGAPAADWAARAVTEGMAVAALGFGAGCELSVSAFETEDSVFVVLGVAGPGDARRRGESRLRLWVVPGAP